MSHFLPSASAEYEELNNRQLAAKTKTDSCCERCRRDKKRCEGGVPCNRCVDKDRPCSLVDEHMACIRGPTATSTNHEGGYFVVYNLPNEETYAAHLDGEYRLIGRVKYLGHKSFVASAYDENFSVDELLAPDLAQSCENHIHRNGGQHYL